MHGRLLTTIGYEGTQLEPFLAVLRAAGVDVVVDVRYRPSSRKRGFSRTPLARALADAGIGYEHVRALGTPPALRHERAAGLPVAEFARRYRHHMAGEQVALAALAERVRARHVALLCFEADAATCHRAVVADALQRSGAAVAVHHLVVPAARDAAG